MRNICNICNICKCPFRHKVETFGTAVSLETALHILTFSVLIFHLYINLNNYIDTTHQLVDQVVQSVQRLATGWTVRGSNPGGGEIFRTFPDRPWGPPSLPYNGYRVFPEGKAAGAWRWQPTQSSPLPLPLPWRVKDVTQYESGLTLRRLMSYIYGAPILDVSRSHTTTQHSR